jgi:hypothetical protein
VPNWASAEEQFIPNYPPPDHNLGQILNSDPARSYFPLKSTGYYISFPLNSKWSLAKTCGFGANCGQFAIHSKYLQRWFSGFRIKFN